MIQKLFIVVTMMYWFALYIYAPILTPYVKDLGASFSMIGLVVGSYGLTQMLLRIPLGIYSDRVSKRKIFVSLGLVFAAISSMGIGIVNSPWLVVIFRGFAGVAASSWVVFTVLYSGFFAPEDSGKAMSIIMFFMTVAQLIASTLGGFIAESYGYHATFIFGGIVGFMGLGLSLKIPEKQVAREPISVKELLKVGFDKHLLKIGLLAVLVQAITFSTTSGFTPTYAVSIGASESQLSILMFVTTLPTALGSLASGKLAERFSERQVIATSFIMMAVATLFTPLLNLVGLYLVQTINGLGRGLVFPVLMSLSIKTIDVDKRTSAMGFFQAFYGVGMTFGPILTGYISDNLGLATGFVAVAIIGFLGWFLTLKFCNAECKSVKTQAI